MQATLFTMTSLVLAFTLVEVEANFRKADALVSTEASQINRLDRLLNRYGDEQVTMLLFITSTMQRSAFRAYVLAAQMAVMGAFIGFVLIMDQPFKGQTAVDTQPLRQAIVLMENRDR